MPPSWSFCPNGSQRQQRFYVHRFLLLEEAAAPMLQQCMAMQLGLLVTNVLY